MSWPSEARQVLEQIDDPCSVALGEPINIVDLGLIDDIQIDGSVARVEICLTTPGCVMFFDIAQQIEAALVDALDHIEKVECNLVRVGDWTEERMAPSAVARLARRRAAYRSRTDSYVARNASARAGS